MPQLDPLLQNAPAVVAAVKDRLADLAAALGAALDLPFHAELGNPETWAAASLPTAFAGKGLLVAARFGASAIALGIPDESGRLPSWLHEPDEAGRTKLAALAEQFGNALTPALGAPSGCHAAWVDRLSEALARSGIADGAASLPLRLSAKDWTMDARLVWPAPNPRALLHSHFDASYADDPLRSLPPYTRSLLQIEVPVSAVLATKRQPVAQVLELGPGSLIQFNKSCEELLELRVGGRKVALGEAVKVGDKFGLRIVSMVLPDEQFKKISHRKPAP
ncbi:MAG: FliM/FliN family flagellar motor switch protein [Planctomycetia bacterium]|nr:FliM/FliN family flagellar motor switch protein [Planctomycetia bacterium]